MFKELVTYKSELESAQNKNELYEKLEKSSHPSKLKFHAILCPKTSNPISTNQCAKCRHNQRFYRTHDAGRTLSTMICMFDKTAE